MLLQRLDTVIELLSNLRDTGCISGFTLIGGLAVSAWSTPRATRDIDLLILVDTDKLQQVVIALCDAGLHAELRRGGYDDPVPYLIRADAVDLLVATKTYEAETIRQSNAIEIAGKTVPVASPEFLIILKLKAGGPQDLLDVQELLASGLVNRELLAELAARYKVVLTH
ncbi:MAG: nucleotidyl transferase AbiEii/AbiGii toxin family protein [Geobacter sp.]|nr:nucleotidyl transferase AbiEii/AbiGii toxin family protein [Geobacter sp.]